VQLEQGYTPGAAAKKIGVAYSTAHHWKEKDEKFAVAWADAVEVGLDMLAHAVYQRGLLDGGEDARFILRGRRRGIFGNADGAHQQQRPSNFILNITLQEQLKRLERLGLPVPMIESDFEEEHAPDTTDANQS
jgi:hypothetical protein